MITINIRLANSADARAIAAMSRDYIEQGLGWKYRVDAIQRMIADSDTNVIVAAENATLLGFAAMHYEGFEAHLQLLAVIPAYRRKGVGKGLLHWLIKTAEVSGAQGLYVELRRKNVSARRFYESIGFSTMERMQGYYQALEDGQRMALDLRKRTAEGTN